MNLTVAQLIDLKLEDPRTCYVTVPTPSVRMTLTAVVISVVVHVAGLLVPITEQTVRHSPAPAPRHELDLTLVSPTPPKAAPTPQTEHQVATTATVRATSQVTIAPRPQASPRPKPKTVVTTTAHTKATRANQRHQAPPHRQESAEAASIVPTAHVAKHKAKAAAHQAHSARTVIRTEAQATAKQTRHTPVSTEPSIAEPAARQTAPTKSVSQPPAQATPAAKPQATAQTQRQAFRQALMTWIADHRRYPRLAQIRGWQGQVLIQAQIARDGHLLNLTLEHSSGYPMLDHEAMRLIRSALEAVPQTARDSGTRTLSIPVTFHLTG